MCIFFFNTIIYDRPDKINTYSDMTCITANTTCIDTVLDRRLSLFFCKANDCVEKIASDRREINNVDTADITQVGHIPGLYRRQKGDQRDQYGIQRQVSSGQTDKMMA